MANQSKGRGDPNDIIRRDDYTCQRCGYTATDSDETMVAHFVGTDKANPDHYETRCQSCGRTLYQRFNHKMNRILRYLAALQFGGAGVVISGMFLVAAFIGPFQTEIESVPALLYDVIGALVLGVVGMVLSLQIAIWIEPPNGVIYRVVNPIWTVYESPFDLLDGRIPQNIVSGLLLTRVAGGLFLLSVVLPHLTSRFTYATYTPATGREVSMDFPFSVESLLFPVEGAIVGPLQTAAGAESATRGLVLGLVDFLFLPLFWVGFPIMSVVMGMLPIALGIVLVAGYDKRPFAISLGYILSFSIYSMLLAMISVTMTPGVGLGLCLVAAMLVFVVGADRYHDLGILYHPGYDDPGWGSGNAD